MNKRLLLILGILLCFLGYGKAQEDCTVSEFPYLQQWDVLDSCWTIQTIQGSSPWQLKTSYNGGYTATMGTNFVFVHFSEGETHRLISPVFDFSDVSTALLQFDFITTPYSGIIDTLGLYYRTSSDDDWHYLWSYSDDNGTAGWKHVEMLLPEISSTYQIAFLGDSYTSNGWGVGLDGIIVADADNFCLAPSDMGSSGVGTYEATLYWTAPEDYNSFILEIKKSTMNWDDDNVVIYSNISDTSYVVYDLDPSSTYNARVKHNCGNNESIYASTEFSTLCTTVQIPYSTNFDSYTHTTNSSTGASNVPNCWNTYNAGSTYSNYPYVYYYQNYATSGSYSLRFYVYNSASYGEQWAFLPNIDTDENPIQDLALEFNMKSNTTSYYFTLVVGVTNGTDITTFVPIDTLSTNLTTATFNSIQFAEYEGDGNMIAIMAPKMATYNYGCIDDIAIIPNTCKRPTNIAVSEVGINEVTLSWTSFGDENTWLVEYGQPGFVTGTGTVIEAYDTEVTIDELESGTYYEFQVRAICDDSDSSAWSLERASVKTLCTPVEIPYTENFDSYTHTSNLSSGPSNVPSCWSTFTNGTGYTSYPYVYYGSSYAISGSYSLRFYSYYSGDYYGDQWVFLPNVDTDVNPLENLALEFKMKSGSSAYNFNLIIGVTIGNDISSFVPVDTVSTTSTTSVEQSIQFSGYEGNGSVIAIKLPKPLSGYNYGQIDDIAIISNLCKRPENVTVSNITTTSVDIAWTPMGDESNWEIEYGAPGFVNGTGTVVETSSSSYTIDDLDPSTAYEFYVRAACENDEHSQWSLPVAASTLCLPVSELPFTMNFDNMYNHTTNVTTGTTNVPTCWNTINNGTTYTNYPYVYYSSYYANSGNYSLRFYNYNSTSYDAQTVILPAFDESINLSSLQITFQMSLASSSYPFMLEVGYVENNQFVALDTVEVSTTTYAPRMVAFQDYSGNGNARIALRAPVLSSYNWGYIDDIVVDYASDCIFVSDVEANNITSSSAEISWTENGSATSWVIEYRSETDTAWTQESVSTNPYTLTDLLAGTIYYYRVYSDCGSELSLPSETLSFNTNCETVTEYPYSEMFETENVCWQKEIINGSATVGWHLATSYSANAVDGGPFYPIQGSHFTMISYTSDNKHRLISPVFDMSNLEQPALSFSFIAMPYNSVIDTLGVYYRTSSSDSWHYLYSFSDDNGTNGWKSETIVLPNTSSTYQISFLGDSYSSDGWGVGLDSVVVFDANNLCFAPQNFSVSNVGTTSATISWSGFGDSYNVEYKASGDNDWAVISNVTDEEYELTGLISLTDYVVRINQNCNNGSVSDYLNGSFSTAACEVEDQCQYTLLLLGDADDSWRGNAFINIYQGEILAGSYTIQNGSSSAQFNINLCNNENSKITFTSNGSTCYPSEFAVYFYNPDGEAIYSVEGLSSSLYGTTLSTFTTSCSGSVVTCDQPTNLAVNTVTENSATATWTAGGSETAWKLQYKQSSASSWGTEIAVNGTPSYQITGLTANTQYQVRVKASCDAENESSWTSAVSFTTLEEVVEPCNTPTNVAASNITNNSMTITWDANGASKWNLQYRPEGGTWATVNDIATNSYIINDLQEATVYQIQVQAVCDGQTSDWSTMLSQGTGLSNLIVNSISLYPNPANSYIDVLVSDNDVKVSNLEVYDIYGKLLNQVEVIDNPTRINVSRLANGMYFVKVITESGVATKTFIKK